MRCPDLFLALWIAYRANLLSHKIVAVIGPLLTVVEC